MVVKLGMVLLNSKMNYESVVGPKWCDSFLMRMYRSLELLLTKANSTELPLNSMDLFDQHLFSIWGSMLSHGIKQHKLKFHGISFLFNIPWDFMEFFLFFHVPKFHGILWNSPFSRKRFQGIPGNYVDLPRSSMEFRWENHIFKYGRIIMIMYHLAKLIIKYCILHWFQYHKPYFGHHSVIDMGQRQWKWEALMLYS